ncbi:hypothetical protein QVN42_18640 [Yersinia nurmii]|uniref:Alpha-related fimbriae chaperone 2 n=1 Tax=Yersinia nurmii TaxID=685706 RepID=A0AAW7K8M0_9GAMM|nr:hypothetical protein [Yersinia nurmii]MDN0089367.1 hypothetical protein [Yersinia nurmii]
MARRLTMTANDSLLPLLLSSMLITLPFETISAIDLRPHIVKVEAEETHIEVINTGENTQYVAIELYRLNNPGVPPEQESLTPLGTIAQPLLFAAPMKLTLGANQSGKITLKALGQPNKEQVYRLSIMPKQILKTQGESGSVIGVQIAYMGLIRHLPQKPESRWQHRCDAEGVTLYNRGNIRQRWRNLSPNIDFNLYPNQQRQLKGREVTAIVDGQSVTLPCKRGGE